MAKKNSSNNSKKINRKKYGGLERFVGPCVAIHSEGGAGQPYNAARPPVLPALCLPDPQ